MKGVFKVISTLAPFNLHFLSVAFCAIPFAEEANSLLVSRTVDVAGIKLHSGREPAGASILAGIAPLPNSKKQRVKRKSEIERVKDRRGVAGLAGTDLSRIILAYEPVWAIATGRKATPEIAAEAHQFLRQRAAEAFTPERAGALRILYGGSVNPGNIKGLMAREEIDGALVGGASLNAKVFASIVNF
jgi:hypothetical protein